MDFPMTIIEAALEVRGLTKRFDRLAVDSLDLSVRRAEFYALLGPNGAGKTTTLKLLSGLISPTSGTTAGGSSYNRAGATTAGPEGNAHVGGGSTYNAATGKTNTWGTASVGNNHYADVNGNVYKNTGDGWQQHSSSGWSNSSSASSWGDKESQARSSGASSTPGSCARCSTSGCHSSRRRCSSG